MRAFSMHHLWKIAQKPNRRHAREADDLPAENAFWEEKNIVSEDLEVPKMTVRVTLACTECGQRNYNTMKNKKNTPDKLEMNKYCRFCKKHTLHKETK